MDASPFRSGNSQHFLLRLDAVVDPLRLLRSLHDRCLIILRNKSIVQLGREKIGNGVGTSLYPRPPRLLLAPLGNGGNALRWPDDVVVHDPRNDRDGPCEHWAALLSVPDPARRSLV